VIRGPGRVLAIAGKELRHLRRDRLTGGMVVGIPIVMTLLFGYAINDDVRRLTAAYVDHADTSRSRALLADAAASQVILPAVPAADEAELVQRLRRGEIGVGIVIPPDFEARLAEGRLPLAQLLVDASDPTVLGTARGLERLPAPVAGPVAVLREAPPEGVFAVRAWFNPERRSPVFIVPGLCGVILTLTMVLFTAIAIVRERERGNLELLITTPVRPFELMLGKILPYVAIGYVQVSLILALGVFLFDVPIRGALSDFYLGAGVFVVSVLTLGLFISTLAATQFQAFQMTFMSFLPQLLLSGYMFPFEGMPRPAQWLAELFPITHFLRIVRGIVLRDAELVALRGEVWPLLAFFAVGIALATLRFRKRLD
jgi:ABC-2 type transport system permease protein